MAVHTQKCIGSLERHTNNIHGMFSVVEPGMDNREPPTKDREHLRGLISIHQYIQEKANSREEYGTNSKRTPIDRHIRGTCTWSSNTGLLRIAEMTFVD